MTTAPVAYQPHIYQARLHNSTARNRVVVAGRQSGKTLGVVQEENEWAMSAPKRWPDEKYPQFWWVTAFDKTKGKAWRDFGAYTPKDIIKRSHESQAWFELRNGSRISMQSAEGMTSLVSEKLYGLVCDEFCQYRPQVYDDYLAPMLATTGGPVIFAGSPWGMNWGYETYMKGVKGLPGWFSVRWTSYDSPYVDKVWLAERKLDTPDRAFRQQYLAEFLTDGGEVFRHVDACIAPASKRDDFTVIGLDLARTHDWTSLFAMNGRAEWVDYRRIGHLDWSVQEVSIVEMYRRLNATKIVMDVTGIRLGEEAVAASLRRLGCIVEPVHITGEVKRSLIENLMLRFDKTAVRIPMEAAHEFRQYTVTTSETGYDKYSAPQGEHDDVVMSCALALWGIRHIVSEPTLAPKTELDQLLENEIRAADPNYWAGKEYD